MYITATGRNMRRDPDKPKQQRPKIEPDLALRVQKYANKHHNGNFTAAIHDLIEKGLQK